jgi:hypothetical protein
MRIFLRWLRQAIAKKPVYVLPRGGRGRPGVSILLPGWQEFLGAIHRVVRQGRLTKYTRDSLINLARWATAHRLEPWDLTQPHIDRYFDDNRAAAQLNRRLIARNKVEDYANLAVRAVRTWNRLVRKGTGERYWPDMPRILLSIPGIAHRQNAPLDQFAPELQAEIARWQRQITWDKTLTGRSGQSFADIALPKGDDRRTRAKNRRRHQRASPSSAYQYLQIVIRTVNDLAHVMGVPVAHFKSLSQVATPEGVDAMIQQLEKRRTAQGKFNKNARTPWLNGKVLVTIARTWCRLPEPLAAKMEKILDADARFPDASGPSRSRIHICRDPRIRLIWRLMAVALFRRAEKQRDRGIITPKARVDVEVALTILVFQVLPMYRRNWVGIRFRGRNPTLKIGWRRGEKTEIDIPPAEAGTKVRLHADMDQLFTRIVKAYVGVDGKSTRRGKPRYRQHYFVEYPHAHDSDYLFPGRGKSVHRAPGKFAEQFVARLFEKEILLDMRTARYFSVQQLLAWNSEARGAAALLLNVTPEKITEMFSSRYDALAVEKNHALVIRGLLDVNRTSKTRVTHAPSNTTRARRSNAR